MQFHVKRSKIKCQGQKVNINYFCYQRVPLPSRLTSQERDMTESSRLVINWSQRHNSQL